MTLQPRDAFAALARAVRHPDIQRDTLVMMADDHERALPPPTVAELLPMVDATHEVHWTGSDGQYRAAMDDSLQFYWLGTDEDDDWIPGCVMPSDLTAPGRLVEVSP